MSSVRQTFPLGTQWPTIDPFLFVAHHVDHYPPGNNQLGPAASLKGRKIGQDFDGKDGWNMYHGSGVPGFPQHPHRGFETITYVRRGRIDHSDSLGASARFGDGDTQWMTAGRGIQHSEMFPLLNQNGPNSLEMFQIWLNLPAADKMVEPYFTMLWADETPTFSVSDAEGGSVEVTVLAGELAGNVAAKPPPNSWAARPEADVALWHLSFAPGARWVLPPAAGPDTLRMLFAFEGAALEIDHTELVAGNGALVEADGPVELAAVGGAVECLMLQGKPIGEPVAQHGPFVMNSDDEINQAFADYRRTQFGRWPWDKPDPNHGSTRQRFAKHADGLLEERSLG